jgi:arylsulfatase A-like enzyme
MSCKITRRNALKTTALTGAAAGLSSCTAPSRQPNILFVFADQHREAALGCSGDPNVRTPVFDAFAAEGIRLTAAQSSTPVCCPFRAGLMTGQYAHSHGMLSNQMPFYPQVPCLAETFRNAGYRTGYIGKWHLNYPGPVDVKNGWVPNDSRFGFDWWRMTPNGHSYYDTSYFVGDDRELTRVDAYQPTVQTDQAVEFIEAAQDETPWLLCMSWGPPHSPYKAPEEFHRHYDNITLPPNVPEGKARVLAKKATPHYYGLVESLDTEFGRLLHALDSRGMADNTIVVYTSDHGDMLGSHGYGFKRWPHAYSAQVPFLVRYPDAISGGRVIDAPMGTPDIYPTLAGLAGVTPPGGLDGMDYAPYFRSDVTTAPREEVYMEMHYAYVPWPGWRAVRTREHLYARTADAPWLLFDALNDPYQLRNLVDDPTARTGQRDLDARLTELMRQTGDSWDIALNEGDADNWRPGGPKQTRNDLGVDYPGRQVK